MQGYFIQKYFFFLADGQITIKSIEENYWKWRMKESPEFSTYLGYYENNDQLRSYRVETFEKRKVCI